jgi:hypothetical protein
MGGIRGRYSAINDGEESRRDKREGEYFVLMCYRWHSCAGAFLVWVLFLVWCFGDFKPGKLYPVAVLEAFPQH